MWVGYVPLSCVTSLFNSVDAPKSFEHHGNPITFVPRTNEEEGEPKKLGESFRPRSPTIRKVYVDFLR